MPCLRVLTNLPKNKIPGDFVDKIIPVLSKVVKKPAEKFVCVVASDCSLSFGGESKSPGAVVSLESIGNLGPEENKVITKEIADFMKKEINVTPDRFIISFYDLTTYNITKGI